MNEKVIDILTFDKIAQAKFRRILMSRTNDKDDLRIHTLNFYVHSFCNYLLRTYDLDIEQYT